MSQVLRFAISTEAARLSRRQEKVIDNMDQMVGTRVAIFGLLGHTENSLIPFRDDNGVSSDPDLHGDVQAPFDLIARLA